MPSPDGLGWHTPETITGTTIIRPIVVPVSLLEFVGGALNELIEPANWVEIGAVTIDDVTQELHEMIDFFYSPFLIGAIMPFASELAVPDGWIILNGVGIESADILFPELYAVVPDGWKGSGSITLPDMNGRSLVGYGTGYDIGEIGGEEEHTLTLSEMPSHGHSYDKAVPNIDVEGAGVPDILAAGVLPNQDTSSSGGGEAHNNMPPFLAVVWAIFAGREL